MEIAEEAEDENRAKRQSTVPEERLSTATAPSISAASVPPNASLPNLTTATSYRSIRSNLETSPPPPTLPTAESYRSIISNLETSPPPPREPDPEIRPRSPSKTLEGRKSSQSTRPDLYSLASYGSNGKPKVKLGPRPSFDVGGRPHTSAATSHYRPVSTLPAGLKLSHRGSKKDKDRPKSHFSAEPPKMTISPPPIPGTTDSLQLPPARPHTSGGRPTTSSGVSMRSAASPKTGTFPRVPTITPEKARLMKALELRKKREVAPPPMTEPPSQTPDEGPESTTSTDKTLSAEALNEVHDAVSMSSDMSKADDSGIAFDASSTMKTDESDATRSDSYPVSPVGPSEQAESTRASSISESTDETVQEPQPLKQVQREAELGSDADERDYTQTETITEPIQVDAAAEQVGVEEELPQLRAVAYTPVSVPVAIEQKLVTEAVSEVVKDSTTIDLVGKTPEASAITHATSEDTASLQQSVSGVDTPVSVVEASKDNTEVTAPFEVAPVPVKPEVKEWKVPRSKFSIPNLKAATDAPAIPQEPNPLPSSSAAAPRSPVGSTFSDDTKRSFTEDDQQENGPVSPKRRKRRALIEPIRTDLNVADVSAANTEANFSSDDELMDELQSAVFQEAKPISVSKSPISPVFPSPKKKVGNRFSRAFSSPMRKETSDSQKFTPLELPRSESSRSVSASTTYLNRINQQSAQPIAKKVNLGSGISQRIKALEKLSANAPAATTPSTTAPSSRSTPAFFSVRKGSVRRASRSPSIAERANSLTKNTPTASPSGSREATPETFTLRERSGSVQSQLSAFNATPIPSHPQHSRPESISVTARIIRDTNQPFPKAEVGKGPSEYAPLDLKQSPLVIDHQKATVITTPQPPKETIHQRRLSSSSRETSRSRRSSITVVRDLIKEGRASFSDRRRSMNLEPSAPSTSVMSPGRLPSRPPSVHQSPAHQRPLSISSRRSTSSRDAFSPPRTASSASTSDEQDKKSNRASRMLRRMSSSLSSSRKAITHALSPTVREESEPLAGPDSGSLTSSHPSNYSMTPTSTNIGDVNVQFPDTLLWKRRSMLLDSQGTLILSPLSNGNSASQKITGGATRRFHLSEFKTPVIPNVEMQELPNSVVLEFVEGGGLQVACEDRAGQVKVLNCKFRILRLSLLTYLPT